MLKLKIWLLVIIFLLSFVLAGCGVLPGQETEPESREVDEEGALPEWLLAAHRNIQTAEQDPLKPKDLEAEEDALEEEPEEAAQADEASEPQPAETAAPQPAGNQHTVEGTEDEEAEEESNTLSRSQQMLAEAWRNRLEDDRESNDDDDEEEEEERKWFEIN